MSPYDASASAGQETKTTSSAFSHLQPSDSKVKGGASASPLAISISWPSASAVQCTCLGGFAPLPPPL